MARNVHTYAHVCTVARALEKVGERWSLLVVRDLLTGPKRFTDLMGRLGGVTPKTLSQRLRTLEGADILQADRQPGRREVWYRLTPAGDALAPVVDALAWWGWEHAWRLPEPGETLHVEHLLRAITQLLDHSAPGTRPTLWLFRFPDDGSYVVSTDGSHWSFRAGDPAGQPDVEITAQTEPWRQFMLNPTRTQAQDLGIDLTGSTARVRQFLELLTTFRDAAVF